MALPLVAIFYVIEIFANIFVRFDFMLVLMPPFMKKRTLEMDEQILYKNCHKIWQIKTNEGISNCILLNYDPETMKHTVKFIEKNQNWFNTTFIGVKFKEKNVSFEKCADKKSIWHLNLLDLIDEQLIDVDAFSVSITNDWIQEAHDTSSHNDIDIIASSFATFIIGPPEDSPPQSPHL